MMILTRLAAGLVGLGLLAGAAQAMPVAPASLAGSGAIVPVRDGCGPGGHRSHYGYCKPNGYGVYGPGAYYAPRPLYGARCFVRETYYGPRRICRW